MAISLYNENKLSSPNEDELDFEELANLSAPIDLANFNSFKDLNISIPLPLVALGTKNKTLIKRFIKVNNIFVIDDLIGNINLTEQDLLELIAQIKANAKVISILIALRDCLQKLPNTRQPLKKF